jgi:hypothetical protein
LMDEVSYDVSPQGTDLLMVKRLTGVTDH